MIINSLFLENFGTYSGQQTLRLAPPSKQQPVILVNGLNGAGKTTILEGITLALYGKNSPFIRGKKISLNSYLDQKIHRGIKTPRHASVAVSFSIVDSGRTVNYSIRRSWTREGGKINATDRAYVNGEPDNQLTSTWDDFIEAILPRGIAGLFFFDGEQIESLADLNSSKEILESAIGSLLGLDMVDKLSQDLNILRRNMLKKEFPNEAIDEINSLESSLIRENIAVSQLEEKVADYNLLIERVSDEETRARDKYQQEGGSLFERQEELYAHHAHLEDEVQELLVDLRGQAGGLLPLSLVDPLLSRLGDTARSFDDFSSKRAVAESLSARDRYIISLLETELSESQITSLKHHLKKDIECQIAQVGETDFEPVSRFEQISQATASLKDAKQTANSTMITVSNAVHQLNEAEARLGAIPQPDSINTYAKTLEDCAKRLLQLQNELAGVSSELNSARKRAVRTESLLDRAFARQAELNLTREENERVIRYIDKVRTTLEILRDKEKKRHVHRISAHIQDALSQLMRKSDLIESVAIDPNDFSLTLGSKTGEPVQPEILSAGERQILAIAMLWGLARSSGRPLPVIIDTPLGRLDSRHRAHIVQRYFPHASHQVILLSTDTEIQGELLEMIESDLGRVFSLQYHNESRSTYIEENELN